MTRARPSTFCDQAHDTRSRIAYTPPKSGVCAACRRSCASPDIGHKGCTRSAAPHGAAAAKMKFEGAATVLTSRYTCMAMIFIVFSIYRFRCYRQSYRQCGATPLRTNALQRESRQGWIQRASRGRAAMSTVIRAPRSCARSPTRSSLRNSRAASRRPATASTARASLSWERPCRVLDRPQERRAQAAPVGTRQRASGRAAGLLWRLFRGLGGIELRSRQSLDQAHSQGLFVDGMILRRGGHPNNLRHWGSPSSRCRSDRLSMRRASYVRWCREALLQEHDRSLHEIPDSADP